MRFGMNGYERACKQSQKIILKRQKEQEKLRKLYDFVGKKFAWYPIRIKGIWVWLEYVAYQYDIKFRIKGQEHPFFGEMEYYMNSTQKIYWTIDK